MMFFKAGQELKFVIGNNKYKTLAIVVKILSRHEQSLFDYEFKDDKIDVYLITDLVLGELFYLVKNSETDEMWYCIPHFAYHQNNNFPGDWRVEILCSINLSDFS